ncbi:hypothetical protein PFTANZ_05935, partial [Plasmodium falciparum Tanzania (2000708)]
MRGATYKPNFVKKKKEKHFSIYKKGNGENGINECNKKEGDFNWNCSSSQFKNNEEGPCMPPRRQKLCIHNLKELKDQSSTNTEDLREAFINCAAKETYFLWLYYKNKYGTSVETQLRNGNIPQEFKRIMYYTFGDYRDICLGKDISNDQNIQGISQKVKKIVPYKNSETQDHKTSTPEDWWKIYGKDIWEGMVCGLSYHIGGNEKEREKFTNSEAYQYSKLKYELEDFAKTPQFLRWFIEWSDEFCTERGVKINQLKTGCNEYECGSKENGKKQTCKKSCQEYENFIEEWKKYYYSQSKKFQTDKAEDKYSDTSAQEDVEDAYSAHDYLHEQLEKLCANGKCSCMEKPSTEDDETDLPGQNDLPEALDNPPKEMEEKCKCAIPPEPMSCVEKTAQKLRKYAEKNIDAKLKGNGNRYNGNCNKVTKDEYREEKGEKCIFKEKVWSSISLPNNECEGIGNDRFKIGEKWDCLEDTTDAKNKLCVPPRRKSMCLTKLEDIIGDNISDNNTLLEKIQYVAQNEGDDIVHKLLPQNPCNESIICDAMKYSFADLADIIRGRDMFRIDGEVPPVEIKLKEVFEKLKQQLESTHGNNINAYPDVASFRSAWWHANRKEIWKAMTCNVPNDALLKKRINKPADTSKPVDSLNTDTQTEQTKKCGHNSEPPDYDYIPERYRFLQEWSEYYCKARNKMQDEMKSECKQCVTTNSRCENNENGNTCEECKIKCQKYKTTVDKWKSQFDEQNKFYKELYMKAKTASKSDARRDFSIKFIQQLDKICEDPNTAEKYLDKSTHCTDYKFSETNNNENDAFSQYPNEYEKACTCQEESSNKSYNILTNIIQNSFKSPKVPGLNTIKKAVPRIPNRIKNIRPDAHTIHELVARTFTYFVPFFQTDDKTPPTHNILNDVLPSAIPVGIALALTSIVFLYLKVKVNIYVWGI